MRRAIRSTALAAGIAAISAQAAGAEAETGAALISHAACAPQACTVKRGDRTFPVRVLTVLVAGDVVDVVKGTVEVDTADHASVTLSGPHRRWTVPAPQAPDGLLVEAWNSLLREFSAQSLLDRSASARALGAASRIALCAPAMNGKPYYLAPGRRSLALAIRGLSSPADIRLEGRAGRIGVSKHAVGGDLPTTTFIDVDIAPGPYTLSVDDAAGHERLRVPLKVIAADEIPQAPADVVRGAGTPEAASALSLAWLISRDGGQWALEADARARESHDRALLRAMTPDCS